MIAIGTIEAARANRNRRVLENGTGFWRSELITVQDGPQVFLVEQDANTIVRPHFHYQDEYQVIVGGSGTLGAHAVRPGFVHYAGRHTGYGPIKAFEEGIAYMTLRTVYDVGAHFLPESRALLQPYERRNLYGSAVERKDESASANTDAQNARSVLPLQSDGVGAWALQVPPDESLRLPENPASNDRFYVVLEGDMLVDGARVPRLGAAFVSSDDALPPCAAGATGLRLLLLQFAR